MKPCLQCAVPTDGTYCLGCRRARDRDRNRRRLQYAGAWQTISRAARAAQPWCSICGTQLDLTLDHEHAQVECRSCNSSHRRNA